MTSPPPTATSLPGDEPVPTGGAEEPPAWATHCPAIYAFYLTDPASMDGTGTAMEEDEHGTIDDVCYTVGDYTFYDGFDHGGDVPDTADEKAFFDATVWYNLAVLRMNEGDDPALKGPDLATCLAGFKTQMSLVKREPTELMKQLLSAMTLVEQ